MFSAQKISYQNKARFYRELASEVEAMLDKTWFTNLSNASAALMSQLPEINWVGFYLMHRGELVLGPFQGLPACLRIPIGKGVCGAAAQRRETVLVNDVHEFPGHIACDARSQSEVVIPLLHQDRLLGVLDLDSPQVARFDEADQKGLEQIVQLLLTKTQWPQGDFA